MDVHSTKKISERLANLTEVPTIQIQYIVLYIYIIYIYVCIYIYILYMQMYVYIYIHIQHIVSDMNIIHFFMDSSWIVHVIVHCLVLSQGKKHRFMDSTLTQTMKKNEKDSQSIKKLRKKKKKLYSDIITMVSPYYHHL